MTDTPEDIRPRRSEITQLRELLETSNANGLSLCFISGPGGIGKTHLLHEVTSPDWLREIGYVRIGADASNPLAREDLVAVVDGHLAPASLSAPAKPEKDYFARTRSVVAAQRAVVKAAETEIARKDVPQTVKDVVLALIHTGRALNKVIPVSKSFLNIAGLGGPNDIDATLETAWKVARSLKALATGWPSTKLSSGVKNNLYATLGWALAADLDNALGVSGWASRLRGNAPIENAHRLLIVIDDYESLGRVLEEFLIGALVPILAKARFPCVLIILGRDDPEATHPGWGQHCRPYLKLRMKLSAFSKEEAFALLHPSKIPPGRWAEVFERTRGLPFLLSLLIEEAEEGGESALLLKSFFDRTTRWMTHREREWFIKTCYLDIVNKDTLAVFFPGDTEQIQAWFENESSVREPRAAHFTVRPLIRDRVLRYLELRSPSEHRRLVEMADSVKPPPPSQSAAG